MATAASSIAFLARRVEVNKMGFGCANFVAFVSTEQRLFAFQPATTRKINGCEKC